MEARYLPDPVRIDNVYCRARPMIPGASIYPYHRRFVTNWLSGGEAIRYDARMTKDQVKRILDRVLTWPPERQADVARAVELMEEQDNSTLRLTDEQLAEVRRRRAKKNPNYVSLGDARKRFRDLGR